MTWVPIQSKNNARQSGLRLGVYHISLNRLSMYLCVLREFCQKSVGFHWYSIFCACMSRMSVLLRLVLNARQHYKIAIFSHVTEDNRKHRIILLPLLFNLFNVPLVCCCIRHYWNLLRWKELVVASTKAPWPLPTSMPCYERSVAAEQCTKEAPPWACPRATTKTWLYELLGPFSIRNILIILSLWQEDAKNTGV